MIDSTSDFVAIPLTSALLVIPERMYVAGLTLGQVLRRKADTDGRRPTERSGADVSV